MEVLVKYKRWKTVTEVLTCFCCLLNNSFFQIMFIASFNYNLNGVEGESIISNNFQN